MGNCLAAPAAVNQAHGLLGHAKYATIRDRFETIEEVQQELRKAGLESSELIVCVDFTKSNESNGKCFGGKCLHDLSSGTNPYVMVLSVVCQTLRAFDDDQMISAYGFGDILSRDKDLFSFARNDVQLHSLPKVLQAYHNLAPHVQLSGPTSFAPAINKAMDLVRSSDGRFHILLLIADGQVVPGQCMESTKRAIVEASHYPLSIIMVGVGDGEQNGVDEPDSTAVAPREHNSSAQDHALAQSGTLDFYRSHFDKVLASERQMPIQQTTHRQLKDLNSVGWQPSQIRRHCMIQASVSPTSDPFPAPKHLAAYGIKPRTQGTYALQQGKDDSSTSVVFSTIAEAASFALFNRYVDVMHMCLPYATAANELSAEESASLLHATNHIIQKMDAVKKNNLCLANKSIDQADARDQGFVRPSVLMLAPMRCIALTIALRFASLAQRENRNDSIQGKDRLLKEFSAFDAAMTKKNVNRPAEHKALFSGTNTDDHFCLGIKVTRGAVKFFAPLYESDVILASPLAMATRLAEGDKDKADILSSIDVAIIYRADIMLMQNWAHVETVIHALNRLPSQSHDTDIMRVRPYFLEELGKMYRQTIVFSSFEGPELNAVASTLCNHDGYVHISSKYGGLLSKIVPQAHHLFQQFFCDSHEDAIDHRFQTFAKHVWPRIADARAPGVLLFVSSYYDFVRVRNFLKAQGASFGVYCEYTQGPDVLRVRNRFAQQERRILLFTERAHFYFRPFLRGVHEVVFYSLPQHPEFYQDIVNMAKPRGADLLCSVQALVSKYDYLAMKRIVGDKRAKRIAGSDSQSFLFKTV